MIEFTVPMLPPKECSTNARVHWAVRHKATQGYKEAVFYCAKEAGIVPVKPYRYAIITVTCLVKQRRTRDEDNWRARFKPGQDALVAVGLIARDDTDHIRLRPLKFVKDKERAPATVIQIQEVKKI